ncbi:MAG: CocE/NonD family hydrolase [bacterium]|nr:CocE/NonD family hydrolase [bacterium]
MNTDAGWWQSKRDTFPYRKVVRTSYYVEMPDGIKIAVDLYLPKNLKKEDKLPAIFHQTRYFRRYKIRWPFSMFLSKPKKSSVYQIIYRFVKNGYAYVNIDVRGTGASFGTRTREWPDVELDDASRIVDWIVDKPWSNGTVGVMGKAYSGTSAEMLISKNNPAVKAAILMYCQFDVYPDILYPGGIKNDSFLVKWSYFNNYRDRNKLPPSIPKLQRLLIGLIYGGVAPVDTNRKTIKLLSKAIKDHEKNYHIYESSKDIKFRDDPSTNGFTLDDISPHSKIREMNRADIPIYNWSGWYDGAYAFSAIKRYLNINTPGSKLVIGPWEHSNNQSPNPSYNGSESSNFNFLGEILKFFDHYLKGITTDINKEAPVHYYTIGENKWKATNSWPSNEYENIPFYFRINKLVIEESHSKIDGSDKFTLNYKSSSGIATRWYAQINADNRLIRYFLNQNNEDYYLTYVSAPFESDFELTGHPVVTLYMKSNQPDIQLFVYISDLDVYGNIDYVTEGLFRTCHYKLQEDNLLYIQPVPHHSYKREDEIMLEEDTTTKITFDLQPISYLFRKGHSIKVSIAGADKDNFAILPSPPPEIELFHGPDNPSVIIFPGKFILK